MISHLMTYRLDILFLILTLLPAETLIRVQTVCRAWAEVITDPSFIQHHCSLPAPISTMFLTRPANFYYNQVDFIPIPQGYKCPCSIKRIMLTGYVVVGHSSHGILCFSRNYRCAFRNTIFVVSNPVTSSWCFVRHDGSKVLSYYEYSFLLKTQDLALIYDPAISHYFKLVILFQVTDNGRNCYKQFHIYSSHTCSWTVSSMIPENTTQRIRDIRLQPCKIGGGSVCWVERPGVLAGYEISTDTCWRTTLPLCSRAPELLNISSHDNIIYCTVIDDLVAKVLFFEKCKAEEKKFCIFDKVCYF